MAITYVKHPTHFNPKKPATLEALDLWAKGAGPGINLTLQHKQAPACRYQVIGFDPSTGMTVLAGEGTRSTSRPLRIKITLTDASFFHPKWSD